MTAHLDAREPGFAAAFAALLGTKREVSEDVDQVAAGILAEVVARGDDALIDLSAAPDEIEQTLDFRVPPHGATVPSLQPAA